MAAVRQGASGDDGAETSAGVLIDGAVEAIRNTSVKGHWFKVSGDRQDLQLSLAGGGIQGGLFVKGSLKGEMKVGLIEVHDSDLQAHSIGGRLIRAFAAEAKRAGAHTLVGELESEAGIRNRLHTFGEDNVRFFERKSTESGEAAEVEIPLTKDQAIAWLRLKKSMKMRILRLK